MNDHCRASGTGPGLPPSPTYSRFCFTRCYGARVKLVTWNVNSIRARTERVLPWLEENQPDVLCMQELKVEEDQFPFDDFRKLGYHIEVACQKTYNGVAIAAKKPIED